MAEVGQLVEKVRSKNAGPFWLTIDIFCGSRDVFETVSGKLRTDIVAQRFRVSPNMLRRFDIPSLSVIKFSLPRPQVQGTIRDRDMHGASFAALVAEIDLDGERI